MLTRSAWKWRGQAATASPEPSAQDGTNGQAAACATVGLTRSGLDNGVPETRSSAASLARR